MKMNTRSPKGNGSTHKEKLKSGKIVWIGKVVCGYNDKGNPMRKTFRGATQREVQQKMREYQVQKAEEEIYADKQGDTLQKFAYKWLFDIRHNDLKVTTRERYEGIIRNYILNTDIGISNLDEVKVGELQAYYNKLIREGCTPSTVSTINKVLSGIFSEAVRNELVMKNPAKMVRLPKKQEIKEEISVFSSDEQQRLLVAFKEDRLNALFLMALGTGLRQGELIGLQWSDIDFTSSTVEVKRTLKRVTTVTQEGTRKYEWQALSPKTKSSVRKVPIPKSILESLKRHKEMQDKEKEKYKEIYFDSNLVFSTKLGEPTDARNLTRKFQRLLNRNNIPYRKFHSLRHTYATMLFEKGVSPKQVQTLLGHSDIATTLNIYTHVSEDNLQSAISKIEGVFE